MKDNILIVHGGAPTTVINASLYGVIQEAGKTPGVGAVLGAIGGVDGILRENFVDFKKLPQLQIGLLPNTPASFIGTSRKKLSEDDYEKIITILKRNHIRYLLFNGGNGSMDTCGRIYRQAGSSGINVIGIPKTIDNDIAVTDHCPGYGSIARYMAVSAAEVALDVEALPIHICIIEAMGRNTGWIAASSVLAKNMGVAPHFIYVPEIPFDEDRFLEDVQKQHENTGGVLVVASEGLVKKDGNPIVDPIFTRGRDVYFGDVGTYLATQIVKKLGIKARSEKPGLLGRSSAAMQSEVDRQEAIQAGAFALNKAVEGHTGAMVGLKREQGDEYRCEPILIPIEKVMMNEKKLPREFVNERGNGITQDFSEYCLPLIGNNLPRFATLLQIQGSIR